MEGSGRRDREARRRRSGGSHITSLKNPVVQLARRLDRPAGRAEHDRFLIEGVRCVAAAVDAALPLDSLLVTETAALRHAALIGRAVDVSGAELLRVSDQVMAAVSSTVTPQGIVAVAPTVAVPVDRLPPAPDLVCVLDRIADPGNVGTVLRAADAAGAGAVITTAGSAHVESPKAVRAAAGSLFHLPVADGVPWPAARDACRARGLTLIGADAHAAATVDDAVWDRPCALVLGSEGHGLSDEAKADCDQLVRLPVYGRAESLNLAAAAAILLYEAARRRRETRP
jgi:RNA methyltransferase, TrmH family